MPTDAILLTSRILMAALFAIGGIPKLLGSPAEQAVIAGLGFPAPGILERLTGLFLLVCAACLVTGAYTRVAAALLAAFVVVITPLVLHFWTIDDPATRMKLTQSFVVNVGVVGGLLALLAAGPGRFAAMPTT